MAVQSISTVDGLRNVMFETLLLCHIFRECTVLLAITTIVMLPHHLSAGSNISIHVFSHKMKVCGQIFKETGQQFDLMRSVLRTIDWSRTKNTIAHCRTFLKKNVYNGVWDFLKTGPPSQWLHCNWHELSYMNTIPRRIVQGESH